MVNIPQGPKEPQWLHDAIIALALATVMLGMSALIAYFLANT